MYPILVCYTDACSLIHSWAVSRINVIRYRNNIVYKHILRQMRENVRKRQYVMTLHAEEEMVDDGFTIFDVERAILTGEIIERQEDHHSGEWKYLVLGQVIDGRLLTVVAKLSITNKLVIITVYMER